MNNKFLAEDIRKISDKLTKIDEMWPFPKKNIAPEVKEPKRWPDRSDDLEQWMRDKIAYYKSKGWDPAKLFSPTTGDYFPIAIHTGFNFDAAAKMAYRNIKREFPDLVKRAKEEISTPFAFGLSQSRIGDQEDWPSDLHEANDEVNKNSKKPVSTGKSADDKRNNTKDQNTASKSAEVEDPDLEDVATDNTVTDLMTHENNPTPLTGSFRVKELAQLLGIKNTALFNSAFNNLRAGKLPTNSAQLRELAIAFDRLLAADASTTGKVLNQLRRIHKST